jgi:transcription initiation factor TFIIH subunit 2
MADSDGEYVENVSDDELDDHQVTTGEVSYGTRSTARPSRSGRAPGRRKDGRTGDGGGGGGGGKRAAWEDIQRSWDTVVEGADGNISVGKLLEAEKRRRLLRDTTPLQRGIIRHMMLVVDMSFAMAEKDLLPNRYRVTIQMAIEFVREYFEQNPISQLGVLGMRDGVAVRVSDMSGNPTEHIEKLREWLSQEPQGNPSLQNALEMCRGAL